MLHHDLERGHANLENYRARGVENGLAEIENDPEVFGVATSVSASPVQPTPSESLGISLMRLVSAVKRLNINSVSKTVADRFNRNPVATPSAVVRVPTVHRGSPNWQRSFGDDQC